MGYLASHRMFAPIQKLKTAWAGFRWSRLTPAAQLDVAFWSLVAGGLFFLFHLHGNSQEIATCRYSLFLWLRSRWVGDYAYGMFLLGCLFFFLACHFFKKGRNSY